ncbi:MAG: isoquinoline 1-oxidoreductase beta subunit [Paracoccaceae bacterium]|jgi:isoquinoline 1-oxidoreductase beta subunit
MSRVGTIARRSFLIGSAAIVGGVAFGAFKLLETPENPLAGSKDNSVLNPYVLIDKSGVTIITPRAEMGQGVQSMLAALVAEELDLAWQDVRVMHGPSGAAYANRLLIGMAMPVRDYLERSSFHTQLDEILEEVPKTLAMQLTGGSSSTPDGFDKMRLAGAAARHVLITAAALRWGVDIEGLVTRDGQVIAPDGRTASYVDLAEAAALIDPPQNPTLKPQSDWRYLGKSVPRLDIEAKSTGAALFGIDMRFDGMLYASVRMNPRLGGKMISFDASAAQKMHGVKKIVDLGTGVGVIASNTWLAMQAVQAVEITWGAASYPDETEQVYSQLGAAFKGRSNRALRNDGNAVKTIKKAAETDGIVAEYRVPYLAHSTMEPMNATALYDMGRLKIWAGNQAPVVARLKAAQAVGLKIEDVEIEVPFLGGGFGRRLEFDYVVLAARIAKAMPGTPIKTCWSREEDMTHDFYRPAAKARFSGVMGEDAPLAINAEIAVASVTRQIVGRYVGVTPAVVLDRVMVEGAFDQPYKIPNYRVAGREVTTNIPVGLWRSVGASHNGFFHESFMDEMANSKALDPLEMRLGLIKEEHVPSFKVLKRVAEMAGWTGKTGADIGRGVAFTYSFGAPTAEIVEVRNSPQGIRIVKVWAATDVGVALDPRNIRAQITSGIMYGLSAAVMGEITFSGGEVEQMNFPDYDALRMDNAPDVEVSVLENNDGINGIGEPGTPPSMPALANALFDLTGKRARSLPLNQMFDFA